MTDNELANKTAEIPNPTTMFSDALKTLYQDDVHRMNTDICLGTEIEEEISSNLEKQYFVFNPQTNMTTIALNRDLCIKALQQDISIQSSIDGKKDELNQIKDEVLELQKKPVFNYPEFVPQKAPQPPQKDEVEKASIGLIYEPFVHFCEWLNDCTNFFSKFLLFIFDVAVLFAISLLLIFICILFGVTDHAEIVLGVSLGIGVICAILCTFLEGLRIFLAQVFWEILLFPIFLLSIIPICFHNIGTCSRNNAKYNKELDNYNKIVNRIILENTEAHIKWQTSRQQEETLFWNRYNSKANERNQKIIELKTRLIYGVVELKMLLRLHAQVQHTVLELPQNYNALSTKLVLLEYLQTFKATTLTEAINKFDSDEAEKIKRQAEEEYRRKMLKLQQERNAEAQKHDNEMRDLQRKQLEAAQKQKEAHEKQIAALLEKIENLNDTVNNIDVSTSDSGLSQADIERAVENAVRNTRY